MKRRTVITAILTPFMPIHRVVLIPSSVTAPSFDFMKPLSPHAQMMEQLRRIMPNIIMRDIMNAQPMKGPSPTL